MYTIMYIKKGKKKGKHVNTEEQNKQPVTNFFQLFPDNTVNYGNNRE